MKNKNYILGFFLFTCLYSFGQWSQIGSDLEGEYQGDYFGYSVSLSSDGSIVAIGAISHGGSGLNNRKGHVRIFENQSGVWVQLGSDIDGASGADFSGYSVSLSSDGTIIAIGSVSSDDNGPNSGHVRVFKFQSGNWVQIGNNIIGESANDNAGYSVSLSSNGSIVAIGARGNTNENGFQSGHVRVYENQSGSWVKIGNDIDGENENDFLGWSVSLSADGSVVAIGAPYNDDNGTNSGHVRVYKNQSGDWIQIGNDIDGVNEGDFSGRSVSLSSDGSILAIGAAHHTINGNARGHVRIYKNQSNNWVQIGDDIVGENIIDYLGW